MRAHKLITKLFALVGVSLLSSTVIFADTVVIVSPDSSTVEMTVKQVKSIFLGKSKKLPGGETATPVEQSPDKSVREVFNDKVLKKSERKLKAYWSRKVFSAKGKPPKQLADDEAVKAFIKKTAGAIGYIDSASLDSSVKAVLTIQ